MSLELATLDALLPSSGAQQPVTASQQLAQALGEYAAIQGKYSKNHPDVKRLKIQIENLESELEADDVASDEDPLTQYKSPLFLKINSNIDASEREIKRIFARKRDINDKLAMFEKRVAETHQVKRAYDDLMRDYDNNLLKYKELRAKELQAELAQNLETENKGESFSLIEPPLVSTKPQKPNRAKIFIMGVIISIGIGIGLALIFEFLVGGVRGYDEISRITGSVPLVIIPMLTVKDEVVQSTSSRYNKLYWAIAAVLVFIIGFHYLIMDLEIFWFKLLRKISLL